VTKPNGAKGHDASHDAAIRSERAVLGLLLLYPALQGQAQQQLGEDSFLLEAHRRIWRAICSASAIDLITISAAVAGKVDVAYVASLLDDGFVLGNFAAYLRAVRNAQRERQFARLSEQLNHEVTREDRLTRLREMQELLVAAESDGAGIRQLRDIPDALGINAKESVLLIPDILHQGTVVMVTSEPGVGKTYLMQRAAISLALGGVFLGRRCVQKPVLYLDCENPLHTVQRRLRILAGGPIPDLHVWGSWLSDPPALIGDPRLLQIARDTSCVFFFDSLIRFHSCDENSAQEMRPVMQALRSLANAGGTCIVIHHAGKAQSLKYRGSSDIFAMMDEAFALTYDEDERELRLEAYKSRDGEKHSITIRTDFKKGIFEATDVPQEMTPATSERKDHAQLLRSIIEGRPGASQNEIIEQSGLRRAEVIAILKAKEGRLWKAEAGPRNSRRFFPISGRSTDSQRLVPADSGIDSRCLESDQFPELVPEDRGTGSGTDSRCTEPVEGVPLVPTKNPPYRGFGEVGGNGSVEKTNGHSTWEGI
jgi:hypothetical protein